MAGRSKIRLKKAWKNPVETPSRHADRVKPAITSTSAKERAEVLEEKRAKRAARGKPARNIFPANHRKRAKDTPTKDAFGKPMAAKVEKPAPAPKVKKEEEAKS